MKKLLFFTFLLIASLSFNSRVLASEPKSIDETKISAKDAERAKVLNERLLEIKEMDKSALSSAERKELRSEVKMIKEELTQISGGVYLSIGAIIIILLLLILLL
ncbi:MAG TPA: hypothetical protein VK212_02295 [Lentimicrobium sp.]|nr:hypothetical protein [Lentimicrobium sp.]